MYTFVYAVHAVYDNAISCTCFGVFYSETDVSEDDCPHRLVPLSWDKDRTTIDWRITLTLVFGGNRGLLVKGYEECDAVIAKWKDDMNKHTNCRIDGMEVSENGKDWSEMNHSGFYLDREVGQRKVDLTRASVTYLKVRWLFSPYRVIDGTSIGHIYIDLHGLIMLFSSKAINAE